MYRLVPMNGARPWNGLGSVWLQYAAGEAKPAGVEAPYITLHESYCGLVSKGKFD